MRPAKVSPGKASTSTRAGSPTLTSRRSFSTTLATSRTELMSTTDTTGAWFDAQAPGSTLRLPTKPFTGEVMLVLARLMRSSSSRAWVCENWARARSSWADGRRRARLGVVERLARQQLAVEQALRAIEVDVGELEVGLALADGGLGHLVRRLGLLDLLDDFLVLDLGQQLAAA